MNMNMSKGKWLPLSHERTLVLDVCAMATSVPRFPIERVMDLSPVAAARGAAAMRISWTAVFTKAFAITAVEHPVLRQAYFGWPWPRLYEHAFSRASIAINRSSDGTDRLCWGQIGAVENLGLSEIQSRLDNFQQLPIAEAFKKQVYLSRLPLPIRRLAWQIGLRLSGRQRAKSMGTFSMSSVAGLGAYNRFHPIILTTSLTYGPLDDQGKCLVTLVCDHRVIDGYRAALCLKTLHCVLNETIASELHALNANPSRTVAA